MEELTEQLQILGSQLIAGTDGNAVKSAEILKGMNVFLASNPKIIRFVSKPENVEALTKVKIAKTRSVGAGLSFMGEMAKISELYKNS